MCIYIYIYIYIYTILAARQEMVVLRRKYEQAVETRNFTGTQLIDRSSGVDRGQREHQGSLRGHPPKGGGAVFSRLLSLAVLVFCVISPLEPPSLNTDFH